MSQVLFTKKENIDLTLQKINITDYKVRLQLIKCLKNIKKYKILNSADCIKLLNDDKNMLMNK